MVKSLADSVRIHLRVRAGRPRFNSQYGQAHQAFHPFEVGKFVAVSTGTREMVCVSSQEITVSFNVGGNSETNFWSRYTVSGTSEGHEMVCVALQEITVTCNVRSDNW